MIASCWSNYHFDYMQESEGEERKGPLLNNVCESAIQPINRVVVSFSNFCTF